MMTFAPNALAVQAAISSAGSPSSAAEIAARAESRSATGRSPRLVTTRAGAGVIAAGPRLRAGPTSRNAHPTHDRQQSYAPHAPHTPATRPRWSSGLAPFGQSL